MSNEENRRKVSSRTNPQSRTITSSLQAGARAVKEENIDWMPEARSLIDYDQTVEAALSLARQNKNKKVQHSKKKKLIADLVVNTSPQIIPSREEARKTIELRPQSSVEKSVEIAHA